MHEDQEIFTITLIVDGENSKLLLSTSETPAKEDSEASGVLYKEDLPKQFDEIVSKIPIFKLAMEEDGSEVSITHTLEELSDAFDLDLLDLIEQGEEILHVDLDNDKDEEGEESPEHAEKVLSNSEPYDIYSKELEDETYDPRESLNF